MHILIRHGPKTHANNDVQAEYRYDAGLTDDGLIVTRSKITDIIAEYGPPKIIYCSPYLRTRQTAAIIFELSGDHPEIRIDRRLSEYLGNQRGSHQGTLRGETARYRPPMRETVPEFRLRCKSYYDSLNPTEDVIYHVTHGFYVKMTSQLDLNDIRGEVELVGHYVLKGK